MNTKLLESEIFCSMCKTLVWIEINVNESFEIQMTRNGLCLCGWAEYETDEP